MIAPAPICRPTTLHAYVASVRPRLDAMRAVLIAAANHAARGDTAALNPARRQAQDLLAALPAPPPESEVCRTADSWARLALQQIVAGRELALARRGLEHALRVLPTAQAQAAPKGRR